MQRIGGVLRLRPEHKDEYIRVHADVWPAILARLGECHVRNYSIFLREPENLMFAYFEYVGDDYAADMARIAADPVMKEWWALCGPMQDPLETRAGGEWWASMRQVFYNP